MQESIVVNQIHNGVEIIETWEFTFTDLFLNNLSLSLMILHATIPTSFFHTLSVYQKLEHFCITNQDTATNFYTASYACAILDTYTCIRHATDSLNKRYYVQHKAYFLILKA